MLKIWSSIRLFSNSPVYLKSWRHIELRKVKPESIKTYQIGDKRPKYIPSREIEYPDYPYGESRIFKQSNSGLYGGAVKQFGNRISEFRNKVPRTWDLNVIKKRLWSETLQKDIKLKLTTNVLRTISKEGGLDRYLTKDKSARIKELGPLGWKLRYDILKRQETQTNKP